MVWSLLPFPERSRASKSRSLSCLYLCRTHRLLNGAESSEREALNRPSPGNHSESEALHAPALGVVPAIWSHLQAESLGAVAAWFTRPVGSLQSLGLRAALFYAARGGRRIRNRVLRFGKCDFICLFFDPLILALGLLRIPDGPRDNLDYSWKGAVFMQFPWNPQVGIRVPQAIRHKVRS